MKLYTDGGCHGNQLKIKDRKMRIVVTDETGVVLLEKFKTGGSSNVAELWAIAEALVLMQNCNLNEIIEIHTDSKVAIAWSHGRIGTVDDPKSVHNLNVAILNVAITNVCEGRRVSIKWIPRAKNLAGIYIETHRIHYDIKPQFKTYSGKLRLDSFPSETSQATNAF